jgi:anti-sigma-K factor RskA
MSRREDPELTAYLLGELDRDAAAAFETAMAGDPQLRERVDLLRPLVDRLERLPDAAWQPPAPPPLAPLPASRGTRDRRPVLRPVAAVAFAVVLLAVGVGVGLLVADDDPPRSAPAPVVQRASLAPVDADTGARGRAAVVAGPDRGVNLTVSGLEPLADDGFYELWLLGRGGELVSLGGFEVDREGSAAVSVPLPVDPRGFQFFDVSREAGDGDPGHSGASVLRGPTTGA